MITQSNAFHKLYSNKVHFFCTTLYGKSGIDYIAKEVECSGKDTFKPDNVNEWFQYPFKIEMDSNKGVRLILDISITGQLSSIPLDTGLLLG
jgi:hypothetical protein